MTMSPEVVICGAGAAGLTLAIELARRGVAFRLLEQRDQPFPGSRGKGIQPRSQEMFEDMGLIHRLFAAGGLYPVSRTHRADGSWVDTVVVDGGPATPAEPYRSPLMVPQFLTEAALRARLSELGHQVEFGHALLDFAQDAEGVTVRVATPAGEQTIATRYLIGADGGRSAVRPMLGIGFPGQTLGVRAVVADIVLHGLPRGAWHTFHEDDNARRISLCPLLGTTLFQLQAPVPRDGEVDLSVAGLAAMLRARTGRDDLVIDRVCWASAYQMSARLADRYRAGRVFLVGDAAHIHPPTGGQGLNTSAQDAYNLGWKLAAVLRGAPAALLDTYEEERRPIAAAMLGLSTRLLDRARHGDQRRGREVQQLDLQYRASSLSLQADAGERRILQPGDRAPDAPLRGAGGQPLRLFEVLRGTHWTLLGYAADRALAPGCRGLHVHIIGPAGDLRDVHGHFADAYAPYPGEWLLVRPDGYVAARVATPDLAALIGHFQRHAA
ncbi:FAD-dependent oxidoreductase [Xanthomonas indica]|uniref:Alkyl hydroperoxide reductase subunit F n=1 Tax=Xanthomonas indica TaxID=2912242 RepID=A0AAU8I6Y4_9XANT|nr:FAD-dependent oxidoreductase [Xanthomonas indica]MCI2260576.1 FAD-dependent oxidoreductase [Xanthomonas indica]